MFSDSEISSVGFTKIPVQKTETRNAATLTSLDLSTEKAVQTTSVIDASSQTVPYDNNKTEIVQDEALLRFLRKVFPRLEEELKSTYRTNNFCTSLLNDDNESDVIFVKKIAALDRHENFDYKKMIISHLCWNSNGTSVAVSLSYTSHTDWCKHSSYLLIYKTDKNGEFKSEIANSFEINTCITDLKYHPVKPRLLFLCTYEGKILIYNFQNEECEITQIKWQNNERISQITWVKKMNSFWLAVAGFDGDLNLWNNVPYNEQEYRLCKKYKFLNEDGKILEKISSFAFSVLTDDLIIVAGEGGILLGYFLKDQIPSSKSECVTEFMYTYEHPKQEIYSIKFSPVIDAIFAVLSSHECVYVYDYTKKVPLQIIHPVCPVLGLEWNFDQENVLKMWAVDGSIYFYDYCRTTVIKSIKISDHELLFLSFHKKTSKQQIAASDSYGNITIWEIALHVDYE